jgi:hypothetical protein
MKLSFLRLLCLASCIYEAMYLAHTRWLMDMMTNIKYYISLYTRLLLARELWNDGQEKYWKQGLFK